MGSETHVSLETLARGAAVERFREELERVADNVLDPNTSATQAREITLKVKIKPNASRSMLAVEVQTATKLANAEGVGTSIYISRNNRGEVRITEFNPEQPSLPEMDRDLSVIVTKTAEEGSK